MAKKSKPGKSTAPPPKTPAPEPDEGELRTSSESETDDGDDAPAVPPILAPTENSAELFVVIWKGAITKAQAASFGVEYEGTTLREMVRLLPAHEAAEWASANRGHVYKLGDEVDTGVEHNEDDEAASG